MATTPKYALRYPDATDPADVPVDMGELATDVENVLFGIAGASRYRGRLTAAQFAALTGLTDGDVVDLIPDAGTSGVLWRFRYNAGSASAYKWEYLGGSPLRSLDDVGRATGSAAYVELATQVRVTCPRAGDYDVSFGARQWVDVSVASNIVTNVQAATAVPADDSSGIFNLFTTANANYFHQARDIRLTMPTAGETFRMVHRVAAGAVNGQFTNRWLRVTPVRIS